MSRHGPFHQRKFGPVHGQRHNDQIGGGISVLQDGGLYFPANSADFVALGLPVPTSLWTLQETSGSLTDAISGVNLTVAGTPTYAAAVPGFTTVKALTMTEVANQRATNTTTAPNAATTSVLLIGIVSEMAAAPAAIRTLLVNGTNSDVIHNTSDRLVGRFFGVHAAQVVDPGGTRFVALQVDRTNSTARLVTDQANTLGTYNAGITGVQIGIGGAGATPPASQWLRLWLYTGAAAEISAAQIKAIGQTLGFTFGW
jgi:hypothetical protein